MYKVTLFPEFKDLNLNSQLELCYSSMTENKMCLMGIHNNLTIDID